MNQQVKKIWPLFLLVGIWLIFTWPFWFKGLVPAPLDFLVGFYSPWQGHYNIPIKNPAIPDIVNQIIPWKIFTISEWQQGRVPLWNPYNFAGTPHAANWQSAVFYPLNAFMLLFNFIDGWSLFILIQPLLATFFTYLFARSLKLSPLSALLSALSFAFSGFMTSWLEWGTLGHAILWLPLSLWSIEKYLVTGKKKFIFLNSLSLSLSLLAGHLQISLYVIITSLAYFLYRGHQIIKRTSQKKYSPSPFVALAKKGVVLYSFSFLLVGFQLFPSLELYFNAPRSITISPDWFKFFRIPIEYLITFIAPDFYGNPVTRNEWGSGSYVEMMGYIGLVPFIFAISTILMTFKGATFKGKPTSKFFIATIIISLLLSLKNPIANILYLLKIPVLATSSPARIIGLISFSLSILAGVGLNEWQNKQLSLKTSAKIVGSILVVLWTMTLIGPRVFQADWMTNLMVSQRNLILPTIMFTAFIAIVFPIRTLLGKSKRVLPIKPWLIVSCLLLIVALVDLFRFHHKFTPYTSRDYWYPTFGIRQKLINLQGIDRHIGLFDGNLNLAFGLYSPEGYDPLVLRDYAAFISTHKTGEVKLPDRVSGVQIGRNERYTMPLLNVLGVKYIIQPSIHGAAPWEFHLWEYPGQFELLYDDGNYQIFENKKALPRFFLTTGQQTIRYYSRNNLQLFSLEPDKVVVFENEPDISGMNKNNSEEIKLINYKPSQITWEVNVDKPFNFYILDEYFPGWKAYIDNTNTRVSKIGISMPDFEANYAFRSVSGPPGKHQLKMQYQPLSFTIGAIVSGFALIILLVLTKKIYV